MCPKYLCMSEKSSIFATDFNGTTMSKRFILLAVIVTMMTAGVGATPVDSIFDSILLESSETFDADAYYDELVSLYGGEDYKHYQAVRERFDIGEERRAAAEAERKTKRQLAFWLSLMVALFPIGVLIKRVITGEIKPAGTAAIWRTVGVMLLCSTGLFAFNYAWLWVMLTDQRKIMGIVLGLFLLAFVVYALYMINKAPKSK